MFLSVSNSIKINLLVFSIFIQMVCGQNSEIISNKKENIRDKSHKVQLCIFIEDFLKVSNQTEDERKSFLTRNDNYKKEKQFQYELGLYHEYSYYTKLTKIKIQSDAFLYISSIDEYRQFLEEKENYTNIFYSKRIILMIENVELLRHIQSIYYSKYDKITNENKEQFTTDYIAVIFNNSTEHLSLVIQDIRYPIFETEEDTFNKIKYYAASQFPDISNNIQNVLKVNQIKITYDNTSSLLPISHLNFVILFCLITMLLSAIIWILFSIIYKSAFSSIQKILTGLTILKLVIILLIYFEFKLASELNIYQNLVHSFTQIYLETAVNTLNSIYKTILYFSVILISYGWKLYLSNLSAIELKKFIIIYLTIYGSICFDHILDLTFDNKIGYFTLSECKNMLLNLCLSIFVLRKVFLSTSYLKVKLVYAYEYSPEFIQCLRIKIRMLQILCLSTIFHSIAYAAYISIYRTYFDKYDVFETLINQINVNTIEVIMLLSILYAFRCRNLPDNFDVNLVSSEGVLSNSEFKVTKVYKVQTSKVMNLTNYSDFCSTLTAKEQIQLKKKTNIPFLVLNPFYNEDNNLSLGYLSGKV